VTTILIDFVFLQTIYLGVQSIPLSSILFVLIVIIFLHHGVTELYVLPITLKVHKCLKTINKCIAFY